MEWYIDDPIYMKSTTKKETAVGFDDDFRTTLNSVLRSSRSCLEGGYG